MMLLADAAATNDANWLAIVKDVALLLFSLLGVIAGAWGWFRGWEHRSQFRDKIYERQLKAYDELVPLTYRMLLDARRAIVTDGISTDKDAMPSLDRIILASGVYIPDAVVRNVYAFIQAYRDVFTFVKNPQQETLILMSHVNSYFGRLHNSIRKAIGTDRLSKELTDLLAPRSSARSSPAQ